MGDARAAAPPPKSMQLGVVDDSFLYKSIDSLHAALDLGLRTVRVNAIWTPPGGLRLADAMQTLAENAHGWDVQVVVAFYPDRARDVPLTDAARQSFCQSAAHLVLAYPQITAIIIGNEPNSGSYWQPQFNADGTPASPAAYFQTAALCYDLVHAARPSMNVVGPATSSNGNDNPHAATHAGLSPGAFVAALGKAFRASGRKTPIFDTIDHHPYPLNAAERPWRKHTDKRVIGEGDYKRLVADYQAAFAGTAQPVPGRCVAGRCVSLWYTEDGFQTKPDAAHAALYHGTEPDKLALPPDSPPETGPLPPAASHAPSQTQQLRDAVSLAYCQPYVTAFYSFQLTDESSLGGWQSGLLWVNGAHKPSYDLFRQLTYAARAGAIDCSRYAPALR